VCGVLVENASHCPRHYRRRITPGRTTKQQTAFREAVLLAAGGRCQAVEHGVRCDVTTGLQAHHLDRLIDSQTFDPRRGVALCPRHHRMAERLVPPAAPRDRVDAA
jgi:hypothetical protein